MLAVSQFSPRLSLQKLGLQIQPRHVIMMVVAMLVVMAAFPAGAQLSLDVDMTPLFDSINEWFAALFPVLAIGGGIMIALGLGRYLIKTVTDAF